MMTLTQSDISGSGGVLAALAEKSCECFHRALRGLVLPVPDDVVRRLDQTIVHADPHLDEYFAELLFRACLTREKWKCGFSEQVMFSATNDLGGQHIWPTAAVFGLPTAGAGGVSPLFFFDEHVPGQAKIASSLSQIVVDKMLRFAPPALATLLTEVNTIDEFGGGHPQNLNNLIKTLHEARFYFGNGAAGATQVRDNLTPEWKRAIVDACLAAIFVCLAEGVDLISDAPAKRAALSSSLENYIEHSPHANHPRFADAAQRIRSVFGDQMHVFQNAVLKDRKGPLKDGSGHVIPQLLVLARVCFACELCWGENLRDVIATHFWEQEFQKQLNFYAVEEAIESLCSQRKSRITTTAGVFTRAVLPEIDIEVEVRTRGRRPQMQRIRKKAPVWVISTVPAAGVFKPNQALTNYINEKNDGCGLILVRDTVLGTTALFKCSAIPDAKWRKLVSAILAKEGNAEPPQGGGSVDIGCWHVSVDSGGGFPPFILNGNKAHQYVPRSRLDGSVLSELVKRNFY